jgi:glutamate--cysteine ligase
LKNAWVEKESLRVSPDGFLSQKPHPSALGSALTNRYITTDFSEALLEFVTPAFATTWEALRCICDIHQFTYANLGDEMLWTASMPCRLSSDREIPLAKYGSSNVGRMKTIYRRGLGFRYGREMQVIAGVHFNYSLPAAFWPAYHAVLGSKQDETEFRSAQYLGMIRNFRRMGWIVLYLFGASPVVCKSFSGAATSLRSLSADTLFEPYATSLRMSDLGYSNQNQSRINISLNSLDDYVRDLSAAICTPEPAYEKIGVLRREGIEYVEIRSLDTNMFDPAGINQNTMRFIEAFLIYCLLEDSPKLDDAAMEEISLNHTGTAKRGRDPDFRLLHDGSRVRLQDWANEILANVLAVAEMIDRREKDNSYAAAVRYSQQVIDDPDATLSARIVAELKDTGSSFFEFALSMARCHRDYFASIAPLREVQEKLLTDEAATSVLRQREIEAADAMTLDEYLQRYFAAC